LTKVATNLASFLNRFDEKHDGFWIAVHEQQIVGSITIDGSEAETRGAHLRWFIASDQVRGTGAGNAMLDAALAFCRSKRYERVYLWTFEGLNAARHLYEKAGFHLIREQLGSQWGIEVKEQCFELKVQ
jgi:GNAT superfamily N-acetyltransferase